MTSTSPLLLLGNCQMQSLARTQALAAAPAKTYILFLPALSALPLADIRQDVERRVHPTEFSFARKKGNFLPQPAAQDLLNPTPGAVVLNLFHEKPGYRHRRLGYLACADGSLSDECPNLFAYLQESFSPLAFTDGYLARMERLAREVGGLFPGLPLVLIRRISPRRIAGADMPHASFLADWETLAPQAEAFYRRLSRAMPDLHMVDMDRIVADMLHDGAAWTDIFEGMLLEQRRDGLDIRVDIEHLTPEVWERTGQLVQEAASGGRPAYRPGADASRFPQPPARFAPPGPAQVERDVASGRRYVQRRGLICALLALPEDHIGLLRRHAHRLDLNTYDIDLLAAFLHRRGQRDAAALELLAALHANIVARAGEDFTRHVLTRHLHRVLAEFRPPLRVRPLPCPTAS